MLSEPLRRQVVVTAEHASNRVPARLAGLGLHPRWLAAHHGWDPGSAVVGRMLARALGAPLHLGRWSRLVADLNRSHTHPRVVPRALSPGGRRIPGNFDLEPADRAARLARYWWPWRRAVGLDLDRAAAECGRVLHISVHSFVERLDGEERRNHFGLLYRPSRSAERALADRLDELLSGQGYRVRRNYPYTGNEDGHCMRMRAERPARSYLGMEVEMNQRWVRDPDGVRRLGAALCRALVSSLPSTRCQ